MQGLGPVRAKAMFGGHGLSLWGLTFGLVAFGRLYLKVDAHNLGDYTERGLPAFTYQAQGQTKQLRYHEAPPEAMDEPQAMCTWARAAWACAERAHLASLAKPRLRKAPPRARAGG